MNPNIMEVWTDSASEETLVAEWELVPAQTGDEFWQTLPLDVQHRLASLAGPAKVLYQTLAREKELTGISRVRLVRQRVQSTALEMGSTADHYTAVVCLEALTAGELWAAALARLLNAQALYPGPQDTRLPRRFARLAAVTAVLRHLLEELRERVRLQPELAADLVNSLSGAETASERGPMARLDPGGQTRLLLERFLSRQDWRERDVLYLLLDFIQASNRLYQPLILQELLPLRDLQEHQPQVFDRAIAGLINEGRGYLGELPRLRQRCRRLGEGRSGPWTVTETRAVTEAMGELLGLTPIEVDLLDLMSAPAAERWDRMKNKALAKLGPGVLAWKRFEKASLFLGAELLSDNPGHRRFFRYLLENQETYRRLMAASYAAPAGQHDCLQRLMAAFNQHPANRETPAVYDDAEIDQLLQIVYLRPDVVEAIIDREAKKDLYHTLKGLKGLAFLPQVIHECQTIFGYITPEVLARLIEGLGVSATDIIRLIASYKEFTADPTGQIIVYVCKGTACFLRGQPSLSRTLSARLGVERGRVSPEGIQFLEGDCFGACHLAPVLKVGHAFIACVRPEDIPEIIAGLLRGKTYANRTDFFRGVQESLTEVDRIVFRQAFRLARALNLPLPETLEGGLAINGLGEIRSLNNGERLLGTLVPRSYSFTYPDFDGRTQIGTLIVDADDFLQGLVNVRDPDLNHSLARTLRPRVILRDGQVLVEGRQYPLGPYHSSTIALARPDGTYGTLVFAEENQQSPPEARRGLTPTPAAAERPEFLARQDRLVLGYVEHINPESIDSYLEKGGYNALKKVLGYGKPENRWVPEAIVQEVKVSNLRGRGGAGFPTGIKWEGMLKARTQLLPQDDVQAELKLMVANGDEGDPGAFMDRTLIQERPHQLLEGMLIAARATGCRYGIIYVRKEYEDAVSRLENAVFEARRHGFLGRNILGQPDFDFDVEIRLGAGAFVAGEKRAIMRAIEGKPAEPDLKAVSNLKRGLWGKPTLLNNVETFANVPLIIDKGGAWYRDRGYRASGGTKIFSVAGMVNHTGLVEVRFGRTLRDILAIAGGVKAGKVLAGVQIGGPSGAILALTGIRAYLLDAPLDFDTFDQVGAMIGSGGLVFLGEDDDVVRLARHFTDWLADESCGQCPACLHGCLSLGFTLDRILRGEGTSFDLQALWGKADIIRAGSQCGLGQTVPNPVTSALRFFPVSFLHYLLDNQRLDTLELFKALEGLRLITRDDVTIIRKRERLVIGQSFTLKKGFINFIYQELEKLDRYRPAAESRAHRFLKLLHLRPAEVGLKEVSVEYSNEDLEQHQCLMLGELEPFRPPEIL